MGKNLAVLASGNGSNAENLIRYFRCRESAEVKLVLTNRAEAYALTRAHHLNVPSRFIDRHAWEEGTPVLALLQDYQIDFIVLAGFLARIPNVILQAYPDRIVNIHPSLLPKFGGKGMYGDRVHQAVIAAGEAESGISIHFLNERYDEGRMIAQYRCAVESTDTPETLAAKVHTLEYTYYPQVIEQLLQRC
ncbi:protein containing Formyl transferase [gut metagenome]|uniref:phosphoribosylglycinamide formyltransferase 1 n=1 Tax=gut metagenome TaxID=749906 RepID=J9F485_9ZZZZ